MENHRQECNNSPLPSATPSRGHLRKLGAMKIRLHYHAPPPPPNSFPRFPYLLLGDKPPPGVARLGSNMLLCHSCVGYRFGQGSAGWFVYPALAEVVCSLERASHVWRWGKRSWKDGFHSSYGWETGTWPFLVGSV